MTTISIIIVTYNSRSLILDCISSILKFNDLDDNSIEIVIVDNSDELESKKLFKLVFENFGSRVLLFRNSSNLGYGQGNNIGIEKASGEIICIMNPDVRLTQPLFQAVKNHFEADSTLCLLGFKQRGGLHLSFYLMPQYYFPFFTSFLVRLCNRKNVFRSKFFFLSGAFMFLSKDKFNKIGKFDENLFMFFEEADIATRIISNGFSVSFDPRYEYLHLLGDRNIWSSFSFGAWLKSLNYFSSKYKMNRNKYSKKKVFENRLFLLLAKIKGDDLRSKKLENEIRMIRENMHL
jgi:GT2 family glycosyltransferase